MDLFGCALYACCAVTHQYDSGYPYCTFTEYSNVHEAPSEAAFVENVLFAWLCRTLPIWVSRQS